jgi:hypothetical protein
MNPDSRLELDFEDPLRDLIVTSETACQKECCGSRAFALNKRRFDSWRASVGSELAVAAERQLASMVELLRGNTREVVCELMNDGWSAADALLYFERLHTRFRHRLELDGVPLTS